ncbi:phage baseplate assembly protein V [Citrobacter sp. S2-9]|uniref:Phage baseplate assembly protein V n=1 Tax=Citrobacter enshiensis TaxID=2971264 RepID=A0ABT8PTB6_9ENTR|nr:phage baseplate assembly protein V [Citrobacter enshiensis]MDN8599016.1 phage baseplate assembly protein V [Citrobacter enshiensis]
MTTPESRQNDPNYAQADSWQRLRNVIRRGVIDSVQLSPPRCRVSFGGKHKTGWLQWYTLATSEQVSWSAPREGDPVTVLSEGGDPRNGVVLLGLLVDSRPPPSNSPTEHVTQYSDGGRQSYDTASHVWTWQGVDGGTVIIDAKNIVDITGLDSVTVTSAKVVAIHGGDLVSVDAVDINAVATETITATATTVNVLASDTVNITASNAIEMTTQRVDITAPGGINLNGPTHITNTLLVDKNGTFRMNVGVWGDLDVTGESDGSTGNITTRGSVLADKDVRDSRGTMNAIRVTYNGHTHNENDDVTDAPNQLMTQLNSRNSRRKK